MKYPEMIAVDTFTCFQLGMHANDIRAMILECVEENPFCDEDDSDCSKSEMLTCILKQVLTTPASADFLAKINEDIRKIYKDINIIKPDVIMTDGTKTIDENYRLICRHSTGEDRDIDAMVIRDKAILTLVVVSVVIRHCLNNVQEKGMPNIAIDMSCMDNYKKVISALKKVCDTRYFDIDESGLFEATDFIINT